MQCTKGIHEGELKMTFMPYRFYTLETQTFLDIDIGSYIAENDIIDWFQGTLPKRVESLRLRDIVPLQDWLCETPDGFSEWRDSREHIWGIVESILHSDDLPGAKCIFHSELGYDEINFFLHPGFGRGTKDIPIAPTDLVEYWCGGIDEARWTCAHLLPPTKIDWFLSALRRTRDIVQNRLPFSRDDLEQEFIGDLVDDLDRGINSIDHIQPKSSLDWLLILC